jgi:hypothetical protein
MLACRGNEWKSALKAESGLRIGARGGRRGGDGVSHGRALVRLFSVESGHDPIFSVAFVEQQMANSVTMTVWTSTSLSIVFPQHCQPELDWARTDPVQGPVTQTAEPCAELVCVPQGGSLQGGSLRDVLCGYTHHVLTVAGPCFGYLTQRTGANINQERWRLFGPPLRPSLTGAAGPPRVPSGDRRSLLGHCARRFGWFDPFKR